MFKNDLVKTQKIYDAMMRVDRNVYLNMRCDLEARCDLEMRLRYEKLFYIFLYHSVLPNHILIFHITSWSQGFDENCYIQESIL